MKCEASAACHNLSVNPANKIANTKRMAADVYIEFAANANKKKGETRPVGLEPTIA